MPWGHAKYAALKALTAIGWRGFSANKSAGAMSGPAQITEAKSRANGDWLTARAMRLHNRDMAKARQYIAMHQALSRGR